ncbi:MAG: hypothetical protein FWB71_07310 [Defluviitaleaceae bacterium]|nr:hypothetical protein [Defluviitaleaceae bacterium]
MLLTFNEVAALIDGGGVYHIAGSEGMLKKLPAGNWIGGSTEYFMARGGGIITSEMLFITKFDCADFAIEAYCMDSVKNISKNGFDNGFSIVILPFDSPIHREYAANAAGYEDMFMKNIAGWIAGTNLNIGGQIPIVVDGKTACAHTDKAVVLHLEIPADKVVSMNIINIFEQDESSPQIEFEDEGFAVKNCLIDGIQTPLAEYIAKNNIDIKMPLVGDYSGIGINVSFKIIDGDIVNFYAPVFRGIKYRIARPIADYAGAFRTQLANISTDKIAFACNCILNFLYGELEGKNINDFAAPITFGEIAYQLVNQTLVYVTID